MPSEVTNRPLERPDPDPSDAPESSQLFEVQQVSSSNAASSNQPFYKNNSQKAHCDNATRSINSSRT